MTWWMETTIDHELHGVNQLDSLFVWFAFDFYFREAGVIILLNIVHEFIQIERLLLEIVL